MGFPPGCGGRLNGIALPAWAAPGHGVARLRGPWLTSIFGAVLLACLPLVIITGLLDYVAYGPHFGQAFPGGVGWLHLPLFDWPTRPSWLFRLTQGLHVGLGLVLVPVVLAKLWSVVPKLFSWPPARSIAQVLERLSLLLLVGGILFEIATGVLNIQYDYVFGFNFYTAHYYGAWVFIAARSWSMSLSNCGRWSGRCAPGRYAPNCLPRGRTPCRRRSEATWSPSTRHRPRSAAGARWRWWAGVAPGGRAHCGPNHRRLHPPGRDTAPAWPFLRQRPQRLPDQPHRRRRGDQAATSARRGGCPCSVDGGRCYLTAQLLALPQHTATLPIACVEGWSTIRPGPGSGYVTWPHWPECRRRLGRDQVAGPAEPSAGPPCKATRSWTRTRCSPCGSTGSTCRMTTVIRPRIIVPALPGVHCTKWVRTIEFRSM